MDDAIDLYLMGDMNGSIQSLEDLLQRGGLSLDEEIRAYHRLGAAYFGIGRQDKTRSSFHSLLLLDPYYDLGPWENPQLRDILNTVRDESMATVLIQGEPQGALVFMEGQFLGSTPYIHDNLIGGETYTFTLMADGYSTAVKSCNTDPGQLYTMIYSLEPAGSQVTLAYADTASVSTASSVIQELQQGTATAAGPGTAAAGQGTESMVQVPVDTAAVQASGSQQAGSMSIEQLNAILHGGTQMAALEEMGPLNTASSTQEEAGSNTGIERDPTRFQGTDSTIETVSENPISMVFSEVSIEDDVILQSEGGSDYSSRTSSEVREVLASKESAVTFIYNKYLRSDPLLSGTVVIEMIIEPSGRVSGVSILDSNTMNPAFDLELASTVETWRFGAVDDDEGPLPVTYPFSFSR